MTEAEIQASLNALEPYIAGYAELLVRKGCNIQKGQQLAIKSPVELADFVRILVKVAYEHGAGPVTVLWSDQAIRRLDYENLELEHFQTLPEWERQRLDSLAEAGAAFLFLLGEDPIGMNGVDPKKQAAASKATNTQAKAFRHGLDFGENVWCIAGVPTHAWAKQVFSELPEKDAYLKLWQYILRVARADGEDPQSAWDTHNATFEKNKRILNGHQFVSLHYSAKNGTDLTLGLNPKHIWEGGAAKTNGQQVFFPNIPTEEVFTTPDWRKTEGIVYSALPLLHNGQLVENFWLRFEGGKVVDFDAERGKDVLEHILTTDDQAPYLGECALVSKNTPIRQSSVLFYDTLYDENASCHLAVGMGFPECIEGGLELEHDELLAAGVNQSATHVDFMIGTDDLHISGIKADGQEVDIFVNGQWAWEC